MQKKRLYIIMCIVLAGCCLSCNNHTILTPPSSGRPYETLVVSERSYWDSIAGRSIAKVLNSDISILPLRERAFRFMHVTPQQFDGTMKMVRSIIIIKINSRYTKPRMVLQRNPYAAPQIVLAIEAADEAAFCKYVNANASQIIKILVRFEMNTKILSLREKHSGVVSQAIDTAFDGCSVFLPQEFHSVKVADHFVWASTETASVSQNFVMYSYPADTKTFTTSYFVAKRDSVMRRNIPGRSKGTYLSTDVSDLRLIQLKNRTEVRGLWRMKGDYMGGPFVSQLYINPSNHRIYVVEVFVYAPDRPKGNLIRGLEASLFTLKMPVNHIKDKN